MTSPFRFDGTGEPETEEERRKRQLREAMRAAQLGLPLASQLPAVTITAPRSSMLDASARRTADLTSAFESALNYEKRQREALQAAEAGIPLASRTQAPLPPVVITPENRYRAHPWTLAMNRAQMEQEEAAKLPPLPKQLTMGDIGRDIALQPLAASSGMVTRFGEGAARTVGAEGIAERLRQRRELINEIAAPRTGVGQATRVGSELVAGALPYVAAGAGLPGLVRSAGMTALESRVGAEGSLFGTLGELTQQEQLQRLAASPYRTAADVTADVAFNLLPGAVRGAVRGARQARQVVQAAPAGFGSAAQALGREAMTAGREAMQGAGRQLRQMVEQQPGTLLASAAAVAGEAAAPGAGLLAAALPATTRRAGEAFPDKLFSRLERAITAAPFEKGTPQQWQAALSKGVAAGEREWVGIDDFLKNSQSPTLTKAEVLGQFEQGKIRLGENVASEATAQERINIRNKRSELEAKRVSEIARLADELLDSGNRWWPLQNERKELKKIVDAEVGPVRDKMFQSQDVAYEVLGRHGNFGFDTSREALQSIISEGVESFDLTGIPASDVKKLQEYRALVRDYRRARNRFTEARQRISDIDRDLVVAEDMSRREAETLLGRDEQFAKLTGEIGELRKLEDSYPKPQFKQYTQPGPKENYREVVLTLDGQDAQNVYRSPHWEQKNPLVHVRMTDRALPSGEKALFVEEIQSDWHQAGRKEGYKKPNELNQQIEELKALRAQALADGNEREAVFLTEQIQDVRDEMRELGKAVPDAPFKKTEQWAELGLKRVIQEAVDKGYDRVVMVRGEQAADTIARQIQQIDNLGWSTTDNGATFTLQSDGRYVAKNIPAKDLPEYVGKDVANRITTEASAIRPPEGDIRLVGVASGTIDNIDLKVGGEGMKAFYDKIVPNTLRDLGKSMGLKIELEPVKLFTDGDNLSFRITPEVRQKVQTEGMRLYDVTGAVPEAVRQTLASPAMSAAVGAAVGAGVDEEDRFRGAFVGAMGGATLAAGVRGTKNYLRNRAALKASGFSPELADAYTVAKGGIDFTGAEAKRIQRGQRGPFRVQVENIFNNLTDVGRTIDILAGKAEALGMPPEASVGTAYDIALGSDITAARALRHGLNLPGLKLVEKGGIVSPLTREIIGEPLEDVFKPLGGNVAKNEQGMTYLVALRNIGRYDAAAAQARQFDELAAQATANADAARVGRPAAGVDDPALAQRLQEQGIRQATEAVGPRPDPLRVYGGNAERAAADRQIVEQFGQKPEFVEFASRMEQYFDNLTRYAVESGLWTAEQAARIRNSDAFYIPFKRLIEAYTGGGAPMRGRVTPGQVGAGVKRFTGSDLIIGNPAEAIAEYTAALIRRSDMYRVGETLIDTAKRMGPEYAGLVTKLDANDPQVRALNVAQAEAAYRQLGMSEEDAQQMANLFLRMDDKNPVIFKNTPQGREYYLLNDPQVFRALQVLNPQDGAAVQAILTVFGPLKNITTAFATQFSPGFWLGTNVPRDVVTGASYNRVTLGDVGFGFKEAIKSLAGRSEFAEQVSRAGMGQVSQYGGTINPEAIARQIAPTTAGEALRADIRKFAGAPMRTLERVGRATELPMRLAAARMAQRKATEAGVTPRGQMALASRAGARATVDFRRRSGYALDRLAEGIIPYYGAGKKGLARAIQGTMEDPKRVQAAAGLIVLAAVFEYLSSRGEERREFVDRPAGERARYLHYGNTRVALPQEFAVVAAATRLGLAQLEQDDPFAFEQFKQSIFNVLPPVATDVAKGDIAAAVAPMPVARQAVELSRNRSAFQDRPIVSPSMMRRLPEARRYETTAPTYDVLARGARAIGLEEASPIQAEYAVRGIFGRFAPAVTGLTDIAAAPLAQQQAAERVPLPMSRQPLNPVTGFTARPVSRGQTEQEYYDMRTQIQQAKTTLNAFRTEIREAKKRKDQQAVTETEAQVRKLVGENPMFAAVFADRTDKRIDKILSTVDDKLEQADAKRDIITAQFRNKKITGQRARQLLDENDQKRAELFRRAYAELTRRVPQ